MRRLYGINNPIIEDSETLNQNLPWAPPTSQESRRRRAQRKRAVVRAEKRMKVLGLIP